MAVEMQREGSVERTACTPCAPKDAHGSAGFRQALGRVACTPAFALGAVTCFRAVVRARRPLNVIVLSGVAGRRTGWGHLRLFRGPGSFLTGVAAEQRGQHEEEHAGGQSRATHAWASGGGRHHSTTLQRKGELNRRGELSPNDDD